MLSYPVQPLEVYIDGNLDYIIQVSAKCRKWGNIKSTTSQSSLPRNNTGAIVGGVVGLVAVMLIVAVTAIIIVVSIVMRCGQSPGK